MREFLLSEFRESTFKKIDKFSINTKMQVLHLREFRKVHLYTHRMVVYYFITSSAPLVFSRILQSERI